jgi:hypothetical protein
MGFSNIVGCIMVIVAVLCILAGIVAWFAVGLIPLVLLGIGFLSGVPAPADWLYQVVMEIVVMVILVPIWNWFWVFVAGLGAAIAR